MNFKHDRLLTLLYNVTGERDHELSIFMLETLDNELLNVELVNSDWSVASQCELAQELAESFQVSLDLTECS